MQQYYDNADNSISWPPHGGAVREVAEALWNVLPRVLDARTLEIVGLPSQLAATLRENEAAGVPSTATAAAGAVTEALELLIELGAIRRTGGRRSGPFRRWLNPALADRLEDPIDAALDCPYWRWVRAGSPSGDKPEGEGAGLAWGRDGPSLAKLERRKAAIIDKMRELARHLCALERELSALEAT